MQPRTPNPIQKAKQDALQFTLYRHTAILLIRSHDAPRFNADENGSGVLLQHSGRFYIATADHIVKKGQSLSGLASFPADSISNRMRYESDALTIPLNSVYVHQNIHLDIALIEIPAECASNLLLAPITVSDFSEIAIQDDPERATAAWAGFPAQLRLPTETEVAIGFSVSATGPLVPYPESEDDQRFTEKPLPPPNKEYDVWLHRPKDGISMQTGQAMSINDFDLGGISGCGMWSLPKPPANKELTYYAGRVKLIAIQHSRNFLADGSQVARGTSVRAVREILESMPRRQST